jgi:hypothetical protein
MNETIILIIAILAVAAFVVFLAVRGKKEIIYKMIYALVNEAEECFGSGAGKQKFAYVMERIYAELPPIFKVLIDYKTLEKWIEEALAEAKEHWAEKANITDEPPIVHGFGQE